MNYNNNTAKEVAAILLEIKAIKLQPSNPFTWASGLRSPIYCDNRIALSFPEKRKYIKDQLVAAIKTHFTDAEVVAGVATAGIPQGALIADAMDLPFAYVRSSAKAHGMTNKIEGKIEPGQKVVVVEDLISTGKSSLNAVDAIRNAGGVVIGMIAIFSYDLEVAQKNFNDKDCELITLSDYNVMIEKAVADNYVSNNDKNRLLEWRKNPQAWSDAVENK